MRAARLAAAVLAATAIVAIAAGTASAALVFNNNPSPKPGDVPSTKLRERDLGIRRPGQIEHYITGHHNP